MIETSQDAKTGVASSGRGFIRPALVLLLIISLFVGAISFVIPGSSKYHGDERFYTDAALQMCDTGDYWTPHLANGRIRLLKPILAYWGVVASFKTFGVSLVSSRLPTVLAGVFTLLAAYSLGRVVFKSSRIGMLSAVLAASNIEFLTLSARATPDGLVTLFCTLSMLGFAMVWFGEGRGLAGAMLAWCGMGLAIQTKGLLGLCPLGANLLFVLLARPPELRQRLRALFDWRAVLAGVIIGTFWYVAMVRLHGTGALRDFFNDQVGAKVSLNPIYVLQNFVTYIVAGLRHFLPWTLFLAGVAVFCRRQLWNFWVSHRQACLFLLALFPLLVVGFSFGNIRTSRYMIVSYPALAVLIAASVDQFWGAPRFQKVLRRVLLGFGILLLALAVGLYVLGGGLTWRIAAASAMLACVGIAGIIVSRGSAAIPDGAGGRSGVEVARWCWVGILMITFYAVFDGAIRTVSTPTPFSMIARELRRVNPQDGVVLTYKVEDSGAALTRLATHGKYQIRTLKKEDLEDEPAVILTTAEGRDEALFEGYRFEPVRLSPEALRVRDALQKFRSDRGKNSSRRNAQYFIGVRLKG